MADEPKKKKRRRRRRKPKSLPENLVREKDFDGLDVAELMGDASMEIAEEAKAIEAGDSPFSQAKNPFSPQPETPQPETPQPEKVEDVLPPGFLTLPEVEDGSYQKYQFTLAVSKVSIGAAQQGKFRVPEVTFTCRIAVTNYYLFEIEGGAKRPGIHYLPLTDSFDLKLPVAVLPKKYQSKADDLSPKVASDLLMSMFNQMKWEQIRPAPMPEHERILPDNIMRMMNIPKKGGS